MKGIKQLHLGDYADCIQNAAFLPALHQNATIEELPGLSWRHFPDDDDNGVTFTVVDNILKRNHSLRYADALLALQPLTGMSIRSKSGIWCNAIAKLATTRRRRSLPRNAVATYTGASAVFKILQKRPALLEKQMPRPVAAAASRKRRKPPGNNDDHDDRNISTRNFSDAVPKVGGKQRRIM
jgi:hypothetical protein